MNRVTVAFEPMQRYCKIYIDGEHISAYSDLASCESKDLHVCGNKLIELIDDEICDRYSLEVKGDPFHIKLLEVLAESSEYCEEVVGVSSENTFDDEEEIGFLMALTQKYALDVEHDFTIKMAGNAAANVSLPYAVIDDDPELFIESSIPTPALRGKTVIVLDDHIEIKNERGMNLVLLPKEFLEGFMAYYYKYCKMIPFVDKAISLCRYVNMSGEDRIRLSAYTDRQAKYIFRCDVSQCDLGDTIPYAFEVFPHSVAKAYRLISDSRDILVITQESVVTKGAGEGVLKVIDADGKICEEKVITVVARSFVTSIRLMPNFKSLQEGQKGKIDAYVLPETAEDAKSVTWQSSDSDTVHVTGSGEVIALKPGRAKITASCQKCSAAIEVEVCPALENITLSSSDITVEVGKTHTITCNLHPQNAAHGEIVWELDNDGLGTIMQTNEGRVCQFTATTSSLAKGNLKCRVKGSSKSAVCSISIVPEDTPTGLMTCTIIFTILGLIFSFLIPLFWAADAGIAGYFVDIMLPISLIMSLIGKSKTQNKVKVFSTCLTLNLIFTCVMFLLAITCCN